MGEFSTEQISETENLVGDQPACNPTTNLQFSMIQSTMADFGIAYCRQALHRDNAPPVITMPSTTIAVLIVCPDEHH
jgi:hypothetical protein